MYFGEAVGMCVDKKRILNPTQKLLIFSKTLYNFLYLGLEWVFEIPYLYTFSKPQECSFLVTICHITILWKGFLRDALNN